MQTSLGTRGGKPIYPNVKGGRQSKIQSKKIRKKMDRREVMKKGGNGRTKLLEGRSQKRRVTRESFRYPRKGVGTLKKKTQKKRGKTTFTGRKRSVKQKREKDMVEKGPDRKVPYLPCWNFEWGKEGEGRM